MPHMRFVTVDQPQLREANSDNCSPPLSGSNCLGCNYYGYVPISALSVKWKFFFIFQVFRYVGQRSGSKSHRSKVLVWMKMLRHKECTIMLLNMNVPLMVQKLWQILKFRYVGQRSWSRSQGQNFRYEWKGLMTRNKHVKYESRTSNGSKVMEYVKFSDM